MRIGEGMTRGDTQWNAIRGYKKVCEEHVEMEGVSEHAPWAVSEGGPIGGGHRWW